MSEKKQWEFKTHSYAIADTGDYDGYYELTNGMISLCTKDDDGDVEKLLKVAAHFLNKTKINLTEQSIETLEWHNHLLIDENKQLKERIHELEAQPRIAWIKASDRLPEIVDKKCKTRFVKVEEKRRDGSLRITKAVAYYFPEHFKTVEWEDWDDYSEEDFPYTESDEEKGVVWLRPGWYSSIECDKCEGYWSAPLNVIEWYDESSPSLSNEIIAALQKFISRHEAGLLPDRFVYEQAKKALEG